ncbi:MAG: hypothetical protein VX028_02970 [Nanoarchaeota archaeon]|nr:hypothetical protein [Nanoarchaeota archaeon]
MNKPLELLATEDIASTLVLISKEFKLKSTKKHISSNPISILTNSTTGYRSKDLGVLISPDIAFSRNHSIEKKHENIFYCSDDIHVPFLQFSKFLDGRPFFEGKYEGCFLYGAGQLNRSKIHRGDSIDSNIVSNAVALYVSMDKYASLVGGRQE